MRHSVKVYVSHKDDCTRVVLELRFVGPRATLLLASATWEQMEQLGRFENATGLALVPLDQDELWTPTYGYLRRSV